MEQILNWPEDEYHLMMLQNVGTVVLPPGCGKSYHHEMKIPGLVEADGVYWNKGDDELISLRLQAKDSKSWLEYDKVYSNRISQRLTQGHRWVVMVPDYNLAKQSGWVVLGGFTLAEKQWSVNLSERGVSTSRYKSNKAECESHGALEMATNETLSRQLSDLTDIFLNPIQVGERWLW